MLAIEAESELKEDQLPEEDEVGEVASSSVFQIAEGCDFLLSAEVIILSSAL